MFKSYEQFINDKIYESLTLDEQIAYENVLLEKMDFKGMLDKLKVTPKKTAIALAIVMHLMSSFNSNQQVLNVLNRTELTAVDKAALEDAVDKLKDPTTMEVSKEGLDAIMHEEKFRDEAYDIGDGMITIGYGHAEYKKSSKYKLGHKISKKEAERLFKIDIQEARDGVRRIFKQWKKEKKDIKLTQGQFDAMVSMAFNMGVNGLRKSKFIKAIKDKDIEKAADLIKFTKINNEKFPGLVSRRETEYDLFTSN